MFSKFVLMLLIVILSTFVFVGWSMSFQTYAEQPVMKAVSPDHKTVAFLFDSFYDGEKYKLIYIKNDSEQFDFLCNGNISLKEVCRFLNSGSQIKLLWIDNVNLTILSSEHELSCVKVYNGININLSRL